MSQRASITMPPTRIVSVETASAEEQQGLLFVAAYCGVQDGLKLQGGAETKLVDSEGQTFTSYTSVCRYLASVSSKCHQLLGTASLDRAKV